MAYTNVSTQKIVDTDSGEIVFESEGAAEVFLFNEKGFLLFPQQAQVRLYPFLPWDITDHDRAKLFHLAPYISRSNALVNPDRQQHPLTVEALGKILSLSKPRIYSFLKRMQDVGIIRRDDTVWYVNPLYMNVSGRITEHLYRLFKAELDPHMSDWTLNQTKERWLV